jgi:hypothetical protein
MNKWVKRMVERATMGNGAPTARHEPTFTELEAAIRIDTLDLMQADASQPELFYRVAKMLAAAKAEHDNLRLALDEAKARRLQSVRLGAETRMTVGEADAYVTLDPKVQEYSLLMVDVTKKIGEVTALKEAYSQRKSSLTDLVELQRQAGGAIDPAVVKEKLMEKRRTYRR